MFVNIDEMNRFVEIWLDHSDPETSPEMKAVIQRYHQQKYKVAVYRSGKQDLASCTAPLLRQNV